MFLSQVTAPSAIGNERWVVARVDVPFKVEVFCHISVAFIRPIDGVSYNYSAQYFLKLAWYSIVSTYIYRLRNPCCNLHDAGIAFFILVADSAPLQRRFFALRHAGFDYGSLASFHADAEGFVMKGPTGHVSSFPLPILVGQFNIFIQVLDSIVRPFQVVNL